MATVRAKLREYEPTKVVSFRKTKEAFGGLSNMASGYPLMVAGVRIPSSEALYQACRFPHMPEVQQLIIEQSSPMTAKMKAKPYRLKSRGDWDYVRIAIMKWCLRVKLVQNWDAFGQLIISTGEQPIVEDSTKDAFWGAIRDSQGVFRGENILGRLLMELREKLRTEPEALALVQPPPINGFLLLGHPIRAIGRTPALLIVTSSPTQEAPPPAPSLPLHPASPLTYQESEAPSFNPTPGTSRPSSRLRKDYLIAAAVAGLLVALAFMLL